MLHSDWLSMLTVFVSKALYQSSTYPPQSVETRDEGILPVLPETAEGEGREGEGDGADSGGVGGGVLLESTLSCCQWRVEDKDKQEEEEWHGSKKQ